MSPWLRSSSSEYAPLGTLVGALVGGLTVYILLRYAELPIKHWFSITSLVATTLAGGGFGNYFEDKLNDRYSPSISWSILAGIGGGLVGILAVAFFVGVIILLMILGILKDSGRDSERKKILRDMRIWERKYRRRF